MNMNVSLSLPGGFGTAFESRDLPVEDALTVDDQAPLLFLESQAELDPPLPPSTLKVTGQPLEQQAPADLPQDPVVDPQQWLDVMLSQQSVQLQARDYAVPAAQGLPAEPSAGRLTAPLVAHNTQELPAALDPENVEHLPGKTVADSGQAGDGLALMLDTRTSQPSQPFQSPQAPRVLMPVSAAVIESPPLATATAATVESLAVSEVSTAPATLPQHEPGLVLERGLKLAQPQARWGEQMLHALRETVEVQVQQRFQQATIRLDPPELGSLEIFISHESGRLSVHISAAQTDVARLLASTSERLRQELVEQNSLQVQVQVSSDSQGSSSRNQGGSARDPVIAEAVQDEQAPADSSSQRDNGVLVTV